MSRYQEFSKKYKEFKSEKYNAENNHMKAEEISDKAFLDLKDASIPKGSTIIGEYENYTKCRLLSNYVRDKLPTYYSKRGEIRYKNGFGISIDYIRKNQPCKLHAYWEDN